MIKYVRDYIPELKKMYPTISEEDLECIVNYGWRLFYIRSINDCDIAGKQSNPNMQFYCGSLTFNSLKWLDYYRNKMITKLRVLQGGKPVDKYYMTLTQEQYQSLKNNPDKNTIYTDGFVYKLLDEAKLDNIHDKYFAEFTCKEPLKKFKQRIPHLKCENVKIVCVRKKHATLHDILATNGNYKFL